MRELRYRASREHEGLRLDSFLAMQDDTGLSRSYLGTLIRNGHVTLRGEQSRPSAAVHPGDDVVLQVPDPVGIDLTPEPMDLDVTYEDDFLIVLDKPAGLVVHPTSTAPTGTLVHGLLAHCRDLSGIGGELRPGIVHRLDKDTTGLLVVAKDDITHRGLSKQLSDRTMGRRYLALLWHVPDPADGRVEAPIGRDSSNRKRMALVSHGRRAATNYSTREAFGRIACLVECRLETGRTHQIRVHMSRHLGCPVIGDRTYGGVSPAGMPSSPSCMDLVEDVERLAVHQMLHAETLSFVHPRTGEEMEFNSSPPVTFRLVRKRLELWSDDPEQG
ncbi:RluA family pseudouridine synthase [Candidatus Fermentibacterales bacterium]|nr:RluA family pseudouridine synthase [Candidatus Fermentibacterales bacterium]